MLVCVLGEGKTFLQIRGKKKSSKPLEDANVEMSNRPFRGGFVQVKPGKFMVFHEGLQSLASQNQPVNIQRLKNLLYS